MQSMNTHFFVYTFLRRISQKLEHSICPSRSLVPLLAASSAGPVPMDGGPSSSGRDFRGDRRGDDRTRRRSRGGGDDDGDREQRQSTSSDRPSAAAAALDFLSPSFDAALALATPGLLPPDPRAPILDNVTACRRLLPPGAEGAFPDAEKLFSRGGGAAAEKLKPPRPLTTAAAAAAAAARQARTRRIPALDAIAEASAGGGGSDGGGPLALLKRAYDSKSRVRVVTRHARGVRGTAVGALAGFDVFFNLILRDVVEEYSVRVPVTRERPPARKKKEEAEEGEEEEEEEGALPPRRRLRHGDRLESRTRSLRLVFLRGDSVVLVSSSCG